MSNDWVAFIGFVALFALMMLRVPVGMAMGLVGVTGYSVLVGPGPALKLVGQTSLRTVTDYTFGVIPMFMLMGAFVSVSGLSREMFKAADAFLGQLRGGLGIATVVACGGFAAICGSSVATAATFSTVAYPEMRRFGYPQIVLDRRHRRRRHARRDAAAVDGARRLRHPHPAGHRQAVHGRRPARPAGDADVRADDRHHRPRPALVPAVRLGQAWRERAAALKLVWAPVLLFVFVIGGLYGGFFTPTEAGGVGASGAFLLGVLRGRLNRANTREALLQATRTAAAVFTVLIGALLFGYFLTITQTPQKLTEFLTGLGVGRYGVLALIMLMYLVLGCLMDAMAMIILTVPIIFPVITALGFDPIWFGVIIVMTVELGLIHPPVGMNVFVIKSVVKDVSFTTIFKGVLPFVATDIVRLIILIALPMIALWLPQRMG